MAQASIPDADGDQTPVIDDFVTVDDPGPAFTNLANAHDNDDAYATYTAADAASSLLWSDFTLTARPKGIEFLIQAKAGIASNIEFVAYTIYRNDEPIYTDTDGRFLNTSETTISLGGASELFGQDWQKGDTISIEIEWYTDASDTLSVDFGRVSIVAAPPTTSYTYDAVGNRLTLTDPVSNTTTWLYDPLNRVVEETNELDDSRYFEYDDVGNLRFLTDRNERVTEYSYDNLYRRTTEEWYDNTPAVIRTLTWDYDLGGQLLEASDAAATYTYAYDNLGRLLTETQELDGLTPTVVFDRTYDANGNRLQTAVTLGANDDFVNDYVFDALNRVQQIKQSGQSGGNSVAAKRFDFTFNDDSQLASISRYADLAGAEFVAETTYTYDGLGRLTQLWHAQDATDLAGYDYTYNAASRIEEIDSHVDGLTTYAHDFTGQLTDADHTGQTDEAYSYDENGNRTLIDHVVDANNRLMSDGAFDYDYDDEGNRIEKIDNATDESIEYAWDHRNRLTTITFKDDLGAPTKIVHQVYDIFNRWIGQQIDVDADDDIDSLTNFVYDGNQVALEFDGAADTDLTNRYVWGATIDQLLADEKVTALNAAGAIVWSLTDHLGTIRDLAEYTNGPDTTAVANHIRYDSFGNIIDESDNGVTHRFGFTGRPFDGQSGLQNNLWRWYDAVIGQWTSQDPIGFLARDSNLIRYVGNATITGRDPFGLKEELHKLPPVSLDGVTAQVSVVTGLNQDNVTDGVIVGVVLPPNSGININDLHWMQFIRSRLLDKNGKDVEGCLAKLDSGIYLLHGEWMLDTRLDPKKGFYSPYYDVTVKGSVIRKPTALSIVDKPDVGKNRQCKGAVKGITEVKDYLVYKGRIVYEVTWTQTWGNPNSPPTYSDVNGYATTGLDHEVNTMFWRYGWYVYDNSGDTTDYTSYVGPNPFYHYIPSGWHD